MSTQLMTGEGRITVRGMGNRPATAMLRFAPDALGVNVFVTLTVPSGEDMQFEVHMPNESFSTLLDEIRAASIPAPLLAEETAEVVALPESTRPSARTPEDTIPDAPVLDLSWAPGSVDIQLPTRPPILLRIAGGDGHARYVADAVLRRIRSWGAPVSDDLFPT